VLGVLKTDKELAELLVPDSAAASSASSTSRPSAHAPVPDHFSVLSLPPPQVNVAGEGVWLVDDEELKRAFKRLVLVLHPDKNPTPGADTAFEAVKSAHSTLSAPGSRYDYVRAYVAFRAALARRDAAFVPAARGVGSATLEDTLKQGAVLTALKAQQAAAVQKKLQEQTAAKISAARAGDAAKARAEQQDRNEALKRKIVGGKPVAAKAAAAAAKERKDDGSGSGSDSDDEGISVAEKIRRAKANGRQTKKDSHALDHAALSHLSRYGPYEVR